jgi:asparagine synthase (glutamine-hydrolysing)
VFAAIYHSDASPRVSLVHSDAGEDGRCFEALDGRLWLAGRIRLDAREILRERLTQAGVAHAGALADPLLCLHAYATWGEGFLDRIAGDFSFVLWDEARQSLLAVRDRFGVRPLFHARAGAAYLMSDSLDWLARRLGDGELDDYWVSDFLILGFSREVERTAYRNIHRLAPGHVLRLADVGATLRRYWRLSADEPLHLRDPRDYGERFRELARLAIADRLPAGTVGISMSGGVDSTALAACTLEVTGSAGRVVAECEYYEQAKHLREEHFAALAARHLGIDLSFRVFDQLAYDVDWRERGIAWAEPTRAITSAHNYRVVNRQLAERAAVWFWGEGPDNALQLDRDAYLSWLAGRGHWLRLATALLQYGRVKGVAGWRETLRRRTQAEAPQIAYSAPPRWLDHGLVERLRLAERDRDLGDGGERAHPWHPAALASLTSPIWQGFFDDFDLQESLAPIVWRHPFLDVRLLEFMFAVPPIPWAWKKTLVRDSMVGRLPDEVVAREKTPLSLYPEAILMQKHGAPEFARGSELARYVDVRRLPSFEESPYEFYRAMSVQALDYWLASRPQGASQRV